MLPLIYLAAAGKLWLLQEFGRVVVIDMAAYEASADLTRPWASEVAAWLKRGLGSGADRRRRNLRTEPAEPTSWPTGRPVFKLRGPGVRAIRGTALVDAVAELGGPARVPP